MIDHIQYKSQLRAQAYLNTKPQKKRADPWLTVCAVMVTVVLLFCVLWG